eukprot:CAMPEP_0168408528 /NCGR_PEP_ID=MMETSP0228-20121227/26716_1 /TAXON_ID=133427 /ORGANISM="Protoceratium reticulatum, Strain CCCM 535 (=CCMP 1889)" /LENGTH=125 /DNA_ID=CAMNT_0008422215 /DNA_START=9 /DNA_END=382 /DNA_ORIENTATION=+
MAGLVIFPPTLATLAEVSELSGRFAAGCEKAGLPLSEPVSPSTRAPSCWESEFQELDTEAGSEGNRFSRVSSFPWSHSEREEHAAAGELQSPEDSDDELGLGGTGGTAVPAMAELFGEEDLAARR